MSLIHRLICRIINKIITKIVPLINERSNYPKFDPSDTEVDLAKLKTGNKLVLEVQIVMNSSNDLSLIVPSESTILVHQN